MFSGKFYIVQSNGQGYELNVDPPGNGGTFTGTATVRWNSIPLGTKTLTIPIDGGFWTSEDHTSWIVDVGKAEGDEAQFAHLYPYAKRARYNGFLSRVITGNGSDMWSGVMVDLDNMASQATWIADGPYQ
ncbi:hypothetical protein NLX86_33780 [Streptomyces sp. A3M-1-3]|uniref:hypothetical protein n=1 Tax=Streptomyces sp. A3M-1-3 TaxID=2962044 RepID=UPI0020B79576|nr:hypothetical protein [Streptomyces sp. A3M-1-3]MCP3822867.1 hypothetical protein [Streptomyces sp. A3M-1-3]